MKSSLQTVADRINAGELAEALVESKKSNGDDDHVAKKVQAYLLLENGKYPEADVLCSKLLKTNGLDHELLCYRGIARTELGLWYSAIRDLRLSAGVFPLRSMEARIEITSRRACLSISDGMRLDGGTFTDFLDRAKIYLLQKDFERAERDLKSASAIAPERGVVHKFMASVLAERGERRQAIDLLEKFLADEPEDLDANLLKARLKADDGKLRIALLILRGVSNREKKDEESQLKVGQCRLAIRDFHGAIEAFDQTLKLNSLSVGAYFGRGTAYHEIRRYEAAIADFEVAIANGGPNARFYTMLGESKLAINEINEASRAFKHAMKLESHSLDARLGYAKVKNARGNRPEALKLSSEVSKKEVKNAEAAHFSGTVYFDEKQFDAAIESFTKAIELSLDSHGKSANYYRRGTARLENDNVVEAVNDFEKAIRLRPFHVGSLVWRGYAYGKLGKWALAIGDLQAAIDLNPMAADQYKKLGEFIAEHAIKHFGNLIKADKSDAEAYYNRGMANLFLQKTDRAYLDFQQALTIDPKHGEAQVRLGTLYLADKQSKKAYTFFTNAVKSSPSATTLLLRAEAMLQMGVVQPAILDIRDAIRTSRNNDRLYVRRGELHVARENYPKAFDDFGLSIALNFDNFQAFRERGKLLFKLTQFSAAIEDFSMSLHFFPGQPLVLVDRGNAYLQIEEFEKAAADFESALAIEVHLEAYLGRAKALAKLGREQDALIWLTKSIHRFKENEQWAQLVKCRAETFLAMGRFERASLDARIASKLTEDELLSADCYYIRALSSFYHRDRARSEKSLVKALGLDSNHEKAELALDWYRDMADSPPEEWNKVPAKVRPSRPAANFTPMANRLKSESQEIQPPFDLWLVKCGEEEFGPVPLKSIVDWIGEGRIGTEDMLFRTDWGKWKTLHKTFPELRPAASSVDA
jgi:tetratricopeptide (TPR) repeat protein